MKPFDFVAQIQSGKQDVMVDPQTEKEYIPFITNRALSYELDCILPANEMNKSHHIDKKLQFHYFINIIRKKKRPYHKFVKPETNEQIEAIKDLFECSNTKAFEILRALTREQIQQVLKVTDKGGNQKT